LECIEGGRQVKIPWVAIAWEARWGKSPIPPRVLTPASYIQTDLNGSSMSFHIVKGRARYQIYCD